MMDYRKRGGGRSPRRDARNDDSYSPIRRYRSRSRSRSPRHQRQSPIPRHKRSRSRTPQRADRYPRRARSPAERKTRADIEKPEYWGPNDPKVLARAVLSPHRLVVVRKTGGYDDENKQDSSERSRSHQDGSAKSDGDNGHERHVYYRKTDTIEAQGQIRSNYSRRNRHSPARSRPTTHGRDHSREKRHYDEDKKNRGGGGRDKRPRDHRYQNGTSKKNEEPAEEKQQNAEEVVNEESDAAQTSVQNGIPMPIAPFHYGPVVPFRLPPYRPPPPPFMLPPRYPPFIARPPFRLPPLRLYPPPRFYPPVAPMY